MNSHNRETLIQLFNDYRKEKAPKGFSKGCDDLDIDIFGYESFVVRYVLQYLETGKIEIPKSMYTQAEDIDKRILECQKRLDALKEYKQKTDKLITNLSKCI